MRRMSKLFSILRIPSLRSALLRHGVAAGVEHLPVLRHPDKQGMQTIIDIGANRGQFALAARFAIPEAKIISFEPLQEPAEVFRSVFAGDPLTTLQQMAIGKTEMETSIHVSRSDDSSSLLPITNLQSELFPNTGEKETRTVQVKRLEKAIDVSALPSPMLLKIDVQGMELQVLNGIGTFLKEFGFIYTECSFMELYKEIGRASCRERV